MSYDVKNYRTKRGMSVAISMRDAARMQDTIRRVEARGSSIMPRYRRRGRTVPRQAGSDIRTAYCKTDASAVNTMEVYPDQDWSGLGQEPATLTVYCRIYEQSAAIEGCTIDGNTITKTGAFACGQIAAGDYVQVINGPGAIVGVYAVESVTSDAVTLIGNAGASADADVRKFAGLKDAYPFLVDGDEISIINTTYYNYLTGQQETGWVALTTLTRFEYCDE